MGQGARRGPDTPDGQGRGVAPAGVIAQRLEHIIPTGPKGGTDVTTLPDTMSADEAVAALFFTDAGIDDPTPYYHHLRRIAPVHHSATGAVFLSRYDDCREALHDSRFGKATRGGESEGLIPSSDPAAAEFRRELLQRSRGDRRPLSLLFLNPPEHTRQRGLVSRAFTPRRVEEMRARIATLAGSVVARLVEAGGGVAGPP